MPSSPTTNSSPLPVQPDHRTSPSPAPTSGTRCQGARPGAEALSVPSSCWKKRRRSGARVSDMAIPSNMGGSANIGVSGRLVTATQQRFQLLAQGFPLLWWNSAQSLLKLFALQPGLCKTLQGLSCRFYETGLSMGYTRRDHGSEGLRFRAIRL